MTRLFVCHDYGGENRRHRFVTTVAEEKAHNVHVGGDACADDFVRMRTTRDQGLSAPKWQDIAIPANLHCMNLSGIQSLVTQSADASH